ncbi:MAG: type II toxin-antitoxin system RelE/ParE family toxin [Gammaproteobacteria bacterium]|nr:type II toxin-antitoxin system RelE/ParE family toxin [Gammaproteobacteria bacterium]
MAFRVFLTDDACRDLEDLYDHIESHDAPGRAYYVLDQIEKVFSSLSENPERGVYPKELLAVGLREYREIFFKPYRVIYRIMDEKVYVMVIADGRREMQTLLQRQLLQA